MFMPASAGTTTIQFEQLTPSNSFLHLDLLPDNQVRIDDNETTKFGTFPRDQPFIVQVTLDTTSTPKAHFVLSGAGASGIADYTIQPSLQQLALFGSKCPLIIRREAIIVPNAASIMSRRAASGR